MNERKRYFQENKLQMNLKQIPTPILAQSVNLLGLPIVELERTLKQEIEENPFLELDEEETKNIIENELNNEINIEEIENSETQSGEVTDTYEISKIKEFENLGRRSEKKSFENLISETESLQEHLLFQARLDISDDRLFTLATYIVSEIDEDGYFRGSIEDLKQIEDYYFSEEEINSVIERIKRYDPIGCGSRTLEECLITQLEVYYSHLPEINAIKKIIEEDLKNLAENENKVKEKYNLTDEELDRIKEILKTLDPKPGRNFSNSPDFIIPEAIISKTENDDIEIEFNDSFIPKLKLKSEYISAINKSNKTKDLEEKIKKAKNLIVVVEYRKKLLRRIIEKIANYQKDFLLNKQDFLNPLSINELAKELEVVPSTISRAIKDKYIQTPRGLILLKHLFSRESTNLLGQHVSVDKIKKMIKEIIENEGNKPLSDEKIASILANKGIKISRRTVTKYRESMGIPSAFDRKK
ncbi:MAG: RNA polymerase factor sigma-54 [Brevinematia bacterium]